MSNTAPNIADRLVAVKAFADRAVRTNEERVLPDSGTESIFGSGIERIKVRNVKSKFSHAIREIRDAIGKIFHRQAKIRIPFVKMRDRQNQTERDGQLALERTEKMAQSGQEVGNRMKVGTVEIDAARNVEISFEQSFEVAKNKVERITAVSKKSARIVGRFVAVERNLNGADLTLREDLNIGIIEQISIGDDKGFVDAGMFFGKLAKRMR